MKKLFLPLTLLLGLGANAQLFIDNATFFIDNGAVVTVQGDVTSNVNIQAAGTGKLRMGGTALQNLNMGGKDIPNLQIDNAAHVLLTGGATRVTGLLEFTNGKIQLGDRDLVLANAATYSGQGAGKFAETNGTGVFKKEVIAAGNYILPVGSGSNYTPLEYQLTAGSYSSAFVGVQSVTGSHPNKHPRSTDYLNSYWKLSNSGITGGTKVAVGTYADPSIVGVEADLRSLYWNGTTWVKGTSEDVATNKVTAPVVAATNELYGMNKFILVSPKVFLQGAFNTTTGLMSDLLRNSGAYSVGVLPASNIIPASDPYRTVTYSTAFAHVANPVTETISAGVLNDLANVNNQIVDWIFVELRNKTGNTSAPVVQTRSVLLQRDGDLVDIDGVSPVYFKNVDATNNYVVAIRHRNHIGISSNPVSALALGLSTSTFDFTNTANTANIYGTAGLNYAQAGAVVKNVLYAGNANFNLNVRYNGPTNDRDYILGSILSSNQATVLSNVYNQGDVNLNRIVRYNGPSNDRDFILSAPLGSNQSTVKNQSLPTN
ncbi:MAG: hypothetical protein V4717_06975 [Bacteroidota bacterium]